MSVLVTNGLVHIEVAPGDVFQTHLRDVAAFSELLGIEDPADVLDAMVWLSNHPELDPGVDPETGENVWTEVYMLLRHREERRESAALELLEGRGNGVLRSLQSTKTYSSLAAHNAVHQPIDGGECAMDRSRRQVRDTLGVPHPRRKCGADSRGKVPRLEADVQPMALSAGEPVVGPLTAEEADRADWREQYRQALSGNEVEIAKYNAEFLHGLSGYEVDPIPSFDPEPEPEDLKQKALRKYELEPQGGTI